jgi:hypothetical protein
MSTRDTVMAWDAALRRADWDEARTYLADDATWGGPWGERCETPDAILELLRSWKGQVPDVELIDLEVVGDQAIAHLRQPAYNPPGLWFQVLTVGDERIVRMDDFDSLEDARASLDRS